MKTQSSTCIHVAEHTRIVHCLAGRIARAYFVPGEQDDLVGEGMLALLEARDRYDPSRGAEFVTFAWPRVRGRMLDHLHRQRRHKAVQRRYSEHMYCHGHEGTGETARAREMLRDLLERVELLPRRRRMVLQAAVAMKPLNEAANMACITLSTAQRWRREMLFQLKREVGWGV